ncbi:hypothetical protein [Flavobacterium oreochromis]|uniref:DUF4870 domain-containing protein n=2 Tax=Flavobacterium TaxID=237 RepID=A0A246G7Y8_9FLAO|nr:hypothetical protein [Flavobacterium oreochromis]OWP74790.1 hypothetical protein BWK62_13430 [Flavobacterium oreochromis]OWP75112.1 hypothetical protein BWG23_12005 [Flavobacterium oreochromis]POR21090.1 hypothetical protein BWK58_12935 [Flavobacterium columnare]QYS86556.1 hypothetical protein JJC03_00155 [Flavobacterium oreochromis]
MNTDSNDIKKGKNTAIISYILIVGPLIGLSMNSGEDKTQFGSFHVRQGLGLTVTFIALGLMLSNFSIPMATISMWVFISLLSFYGLYTASKGESRPLPLLGTLFQKIFKTI